MLEVCHGNREEFSTDTLTLQVLEEVKVSKEMDRETLLQVAGTSLRTKLSAKMADIVTEVHPSLLPR